MLHASNISFSYKKKPVLVNLSLTVKQGSCVGIVGVNGCGKSTLLSILAGAKKPQKGARLLNGSSSYVPQENPLMEELCVRDNLLLWYPGSSRQLLSELQTGLLAVLQLTDILQLPVHKLSGGMKKRVSLAAALLSHPDILILDEPSAALDLPCKEDIRHYLQLFLNEGGTIILSTHEEAELALCTSLYILKEHTLYEIPCTLRGQELIQLF